MALNLPVNNGGGDFKRAPSGSHIAVCNLVADCGLQPGSQQYPKPQRKLYVRFEIPAERIEFERDGRKIEGPLTIGCFYTASMHEKSRLRKHLEGWRGRAFTDDQAAAFDVASILGKACMINVVEEERAGKTYSNISSIGAMPKGVPSPQAENPLLYYDSDSGESALSKLPPWLQERIKTQIIQEEPLPSESHTGVPFDDDIPF